MKSQSDAVINVKIPKRKRGTVSNISVSYSPAVKQMGKETTFLSVPSAGMKTHNMRLEKNLVLKTK